MGSSPTAANQDCDIERALLRIALLSWQGDASAFEYETAAGSFGGYEGLPAQVALLDDGRRARLLAPISYRQANGEEWPVPAGSMLDGASIPRPFWSLIGGPFEGRYRDASIVHDHYCATRARPWRAAHLMFYEAMRCSGVAAAKAKILYYVVCRFGPRWPAGAAETEAVMFAEEMAAGPDAMASVAADAEAIYTHDLSIGEIEALADARTVFAASPGRAIAEAILEAAQPASALARARLLVIPGGGGNAEDVAAVAAQAALLPEFVLARFEKKKIRIVACRGSITDFESDLRGVVPRGWEETGKTWDDVPGTYFDDRKRVVIATIESGGARVVPTSASGLHGSASLVVHESLHGYDYSRDHKVLAAPSFVAARNGDLPRLGSYERQAGRPGLEETFAESGARFVVDRDAMRADWTHLCDYWGSDPAASEASATQQMELESIAPPDPGDGTLGTAEMTEDGTILLDLRSEAPGGAIGHALLRVRPGEREYAVLRDRLFPGDDPVPARSGIVPFRPADAGR